MSPTYNAQKVFVILDAINQIQEADDAHRLLWLPSKLPANVHIIVSTTPGDMAERMTKRGWTRLVMPTTSVEDRRQLVERYLLRFGKHLEGERVTKLVSLPQCSNPK